MKTIRINGRDYPIHIRGKGMACVVIGIASLMERTLSEPFHQHFEVFSSDLYWTKPHGLSHFEQIHMDTLVEDIKTLLTELPVKKPILMAHSAYGIVALEFAKKYPSLISGIVMIGTPVNSNPKVDYENNEIFKKLADPSRKAIDEERQRNFEKEDLSQLTPSQKFQRTYIYRQAPRYWHQPDYDCSSLWEGLTLDPLVDRFFGTILPATDVTKNLESIHVPIFNAVGMSDYDCCPWVWRDLKNLPPQMAFFTFKRSGHWPHYEEPEEFDRWLINWSDRLINDAAPAHSKL